MSASIQAPQTAVVATAPKLEQGAPPAPGRRFATVFKETLDQPAINRSGSNHLYTIQSGDTLTGIVKKGFRAKALNISESEAYRQALKLAADNSLKNPDLIQAGKTLNMEAVNQTIANRLNPQASTEAAAAADKKPVAPQQASAALVPFTKPANETVLDRTLQRAIDKGYLDRSEGPAVAQKVLALSEKYKFQPDDFARLTLMESGGMNPRASNGRCHGIIQFCEGATRGAAAVGMAHNPRAILGMGLLQQLDLVDAYFEDVGLADRQKALSLDELYLTVLRPAARSEQRRDVALAIPGIQARELHVGANRNAPITRNSIIEGLHAVAKRMLASEIPSRRQLSLYTSHEQPDG